MPYKFAFIALIGLLFPLLTGTAQALTPSQYPIQLNAKSYGLTEGLSQFAVSSITEDNHGYVWVGTLNGLNRYNGQKFRHFFANDGSGLPSSFIRRLFTDSQGRLFVGTDNGIAVYNHKLDRFDTPGKLAELSSRTISSISEVEQGLLVSTDNLAYILSHNFSSITKLYHSDKTEIRDFRKIGNTQYMLSYENELLVIDGDNTQSYQGIIDISSLNNEVFAVAKDKVYIFSQSELSYIDYSITQVSESNNDDYLIATDGKALYKLNQDHTLDYLGGLWKNDLDISTVEYSGNSIYIATFNRGFYSTSAKSNLITHSNIVSGYIWDIKASSDNKLYVSSDDIDITILDSTLSIIKKLPTDISGPKKLSIYDSEIYISSHAGLHLIQTETGEITKLLDGKYWAITSGEENIYLASDYGDIITYNTKTQKAKTLTLDDQGFPVFDLLVDKENGQEVLWVASQGGLYKLIGAQVTNIISGFVTSLHSHNGEIYYGTNSGLSKLTQATGKVEILFNNNKPIYSLAYDNGNIYATSDKEVNLYNLKDASLVSIGSDYGSKDEYNLQSLDIFGDSIIFGSTKGLSILKKNTLNNLLEKSSAPEVLIEDLKIFNQKEKVGGKYLPVNPSFIDELNLSYSDYPFTLTFSSPKTPDSSYYYQLEGLSDNYVMAVDINAATYTNLSPGSYAFNVYARDNLTGSTGPTKSLKINVTPPWWLSIQAKLVYFSILALILVMIIKTIYRRREVQKKIAQSEERLKLSLWGSGDEMWDWDLESGQIYRSNIWGALDFPRDGQRAGEPGEESNIHPQDQERVREALTSHFEGLIDHFEAAYRVKGKDGSWIWILDRAKIVERDEDDRPLRMTGTIKNISTFKQTEEQLKLFERAIRNMSEGMFILDNDFQFVAVNDACCQLALRSKEDFIGTELSFDLYPEHYSNQIKQMLIKQGRLYNDIEALRGDGSNFLMELTIDAIYDEAGDISHYVGVFSDITRRRTQEEELRKLTNNDVLTGLPNRSNLQVTLSNLVKKDSHHTLMVIDLDNFKKINDSLGHQVGDEVLILVAKRLEQAIPKHTGLYRLGGDEFAILEDKLPDIGSGATIAARIIESFSTPFEISGEKLVIGLSIGIVLYPEDEQNEQALLRKADIAMYHAKSAGGNRYQFYSESLNKNAMRQLEIENLIREGLRKDYFQVYYQPKYDIRTNQLTGMEALVRLLHPEKGLIAPGEFIPMAEENGLIVEIGDLVLKKACFAAQSWREQGLFNGRVAVNLSSHQFALPDLQQRIDSILTLTRLPAANLELEITEGTVIKEPEKAIKVMQQLSRMGVSLALDDFGTGYSSLSYLKRFPIHTLKIDKAFVDDIDKSDRDLKMVDSIITIAHNMGLSVVGEGVELSAQLSLLKALNCEEIQGFLYSKALPESDFTALLEQQRKVNTSATG